MVNKVILVNETTKQGDTTGSQPRIVWGSPPRVSARVMRAILRERRHARVMIDIRDAHIPAWKAWCKAVVE
jgi:hypothetical protein